MWHAVVWTPIALLFSLWSLVCWAVLRLVRGAEFGNMNVTWLDQWQIPLWLTQWLPMHLVTELKTWLTELEPWLEAMLMHLPLLAGWLLPLTWLIWAFGALMLVGVGIVGSVLVFALQEPKRPTGLPPMASPQMPPTRSGPPSPPRSPGQV